MHRYNASKRDLNLLLAANCPWRNKPRFGVPLTRLGVRYAKMRKRGTGRIIGIPFWYYKREDTLV
jgi:hypothetical protein